jgi:hypothetical protein
MSFLSSIESAATGRLGVTAGIRMLPMFFGRRGKKRLTKAQRKKMMMRQRRRFVDHIVMNHERQHAKDRAKIIEETKAKLAKKPSGGRNKGKIRQLKKPTASRLSPSRSMQKRQDEAKNSSKWQDKMKPQQGKIKGMVDKDLGKTRSKWATKVSTNKCASKEV